MANTSQCRESMPCEIKNQFDMSTFSIFNRAVFFFFYFFPINDTFTVHWWDREVKLDLWRPLLSPLSLFCSSDNTERTVNVLQVIPLLHVSLEDVCHICFNTTDILSRLFHHFAILIMTTKWHHIEMDFGKKG